jgi:hypothetical protein
LVLLIVKILLEGIVLVLESSLAELFIHACNLVVLLKILISSPALLGTAMD